MYDDHSAEDHLNIASSRVPIIDEHLTIERSEAIPEFFLPYSSFAFQHELPLVNFQMHTKYWLLRTLCNHGVKAMGGKLVLDQRARPGLNTFVGALLEGQTTLLELGFQSKVRSTRKTCNFSTTVIPAAIDCATFWTAQCGSVICMAW